MDLEYVSWLRGLGGGLMIGLAASLAWIAHGRSAGISGVLGRSLLRDGGTNFRIPFLAGLIATGVVLLRVSPASFGEAGRGLPMLAVAGVLVGVGTTLSSGCTSGHGVCGLSHQSPRSLIAVVTFMATGALTVALLGAS